MICCSGSPVNFTDLQAEVSSQVYQVPGCAPVFKIADKCFDYSFEEELMVRFCLVSNCCPDSNRFVLAARFKEDTIFVTANDTAQHLCRCICPYEIRTEVEGLQNDRYRFVCIFMDSVYYDELISR